MHFYPLPEQLKLDLRTPRDSDSIKLPPKCPFSSVPWHRKSWDELLSLTVRSLVPRGQLECKQTSKRWDLRLTVLPTESSRNASPNPITHAKDTWVWLISTKAWGSNSIPTHLGTGETVCLGWIKIHAPSYYLSRTTNTIFRRNQRCNYEIPKKDTVYFCCISSHEPQIPKKEL